jgi:hypothetical protein
VTSHCDQARLVLGIFFATQFLDGALTYWGVSRFGVELEFNSWLAALMTAIGPGTALVAAKGLACVLRIRSLRHHVVPGAGHRHGWCLGFAVIPWIALAIAFVHLARHLSLDGPRNLGVAALLTWSVVERGRQASAGGGRSGRAESTAAAPVRCRNASSCRRDSRVCSSLTSKVGSRFIVRSCG